MNRFKEKYCCLVISGQAQTFKHITDSFPRKETSHQICLILKVCMFSLHCISQYNPYVLRLRPVIITWLHIKKRFCQYKIQGEAIVCNADLLGSAHSNAQTLHAEVKAASIGDNSK
jgi:hypothetical protein